MSSGSSMWLPDRCWRATRRGWWSTPMRGPAWRAAGAAATAWKGERSTSSSTGRCRKSSESVEGALENPGGGQLVDQRGAAGAARVAVDQHPLDGHGRQPFVPEDQSDRGQLFEIAGKGAGGLGTRPLAAVHVEGKADDDAGGGLVGRELDQCPGILLE